MYYIMIGFLLLFVFLFLFVLISLLQSKLTKFNESSFLFQILYAIYNSLLGQTIHDILLHRHKQTASKFDIHHTKECTKLEKIGSLLVAYVPFMEDNYSYIIIDEETGLTAFVDPADASAVSNTFHRLKETSNLKMDLNLSLILCTHKHMDHAGGNNSLKKMFPGVRVISGDVEKVLGQDIYAKNGDTFSLGKTTIQILHTPYHTIGHCIFHVFNSEQNRNISSALFTGDALFVGGCGRFFEGDGNVAFNSLYGTIRNLPLQAKIYCGHEYTCDNLSFGLLVEPENTFMKKKLDWALEQRDNKLPTIPSTISDEIESNIFLRAHKTHIIHRLLESDSSTEDKYINERTIKTLEILRRWRDTDVPPRYLKMV